MKILITKKQKLNYLKEFHQKVTTFDDSAYLKSKEILISQLEWLIAYYEGRTASTPKELLESYISSLRNYQPNCHFERITLLYNWVYYKKIVGF